MKKLEWFRVNMWGAGTDRPPLTFIVTEAEDGIWIASVDHPGGGQARPLGAFTSQEAAQQACQDELDRRRHDA